LGSIGWDTNNSVELEGLWQGLLPAQIHDFFPLIVEGDSQILINMVNKILQGTPSYKVGSSWRLEKRLELIENWLSTHSDINFKHSHKNGNKVADLLANIGVDSGRTLHASTLNTIATTSQLQEYKELVRMEMVQEEETHLDAGVNPKH